jgi:hypothetical protein
MFKSCEKACSLQKMKGRVYLSMTGISILMKNIVKIHWVKISKYKRK